jgi:hypothetical protein
MDFKAVSSRWDLRHPKYTPAIEKTGYLFGIGVPLLVCDLYLCSSTSPSFN